MEIVIYDHQILSVNRSKAGNFSDTIGYKTKDGLHQIELEECAKNFQEAYPTSSGRCIGERNREQGHFLLFTNGIQTKIVFRKAFVFRFQNSLLYGSRRQRFSQLQKLLAQTKYTTYDVT